MSATSGGRRRPTPRRAPRPTSVRVRRTWRLVWRWAGRRFKSFRELFARGHRGVEKPPRWRRTWKKTLASAVVSIGAFILIVLVLRALWVIVISGKPMSTLGFNPDTECNNIGYSCGVTSGIVMTFLSLAFATAVFLLYRLGRVRRPFVRRARDHTRDFVQSAGTIFGEVVGRKELCHVIMDDLKDREVRRPHVVVGSVGVGKTAVLVELTKLLAEHGAVPVPVRLRDAGDELDFAELARARFTSEVRQTAHSDAEAERAWRELLKDDQIVVVADGLEEALSGTADGAGAPGADGGVDGTERDNRIRVAVQTAHRRHLPVVIASRPHDALVGLEAAEIELEPLGEEYALEYIEEGASTLDKHRLDWVIETGDVTENPLYLQLAHELHSKGLLHRALPAQDDHLDTRGSDRVGLRVRLLETYINAVIDGHFHPELPMSSALRRATVQQLSVLACAGLRADTIEVRFADVLPEGEAGGKDGTEHERDGQDGTNDKTGGREKLLDVLKQAITRFEKTNEVSRRDRQDVDVKRELRLAATRGVRLGLVEARGNGVRFPHSIMQAYLASRVLGCVVDAPEQPKDFLKLALEKSGRELLAALVMDSRQPRDDGARQARRAAGNEWNDAGDIRGRLVRRAEEVSNDAKMLDLLVAALELDSVARDSRHECYAKKLRVMWPPQNEDRTVEQAKLEAIARFGEVARKIAERARDLATPPTRAGVQRPAWDELYRIACADVWYPVRIAAAQQLAIGGDETFRRVGQHVGHDKPTLDRSKDLRKEEAKHRELVLRAWLAPLLVATVSKDCAEKAKDKLQRWLDYLGAHANGQYEAPISLEIALAQGFKHAANRRPRGSRAEAEVRAYLAEQAAALLKHARFWFSRLTLVQALCLWALPDPASEQSGPKGLDHKFRRSSHEHGRERRGSDPAALVDHWLSSTQDGREHPFVAEARELAVLALQKGQPERYVWIDEAGVASNIGSRRPRPDEPRKHNLWIPQSTGWSALDPRAQRLVADVLILLNLAERGTDTPARREQRLAQAMRDDLPLCLTGERSNLEADRTVGGVQEPAPGASCKDGCHFDLCPYPPKGPSQIYRAELSEAFCRRQQVLLGRWFYPWRRTAKWQGALPSELKRFWIAMESRARR